MFIDVRGGRLYASKYGPAGAPAILLLRQRRTAAALADSPPVS